MSLLRMLARRVEHRPESIALVHEAERISYGGLWRRIAAVAARVRERGVRSGDRIGLLFDNTPDYISAYYGALAAGGIVVPLNPAARSHELVFQLRHCQACLLLSDGRQAELGAIQAAMPQLPVEVVRALSDDAELSWHHLPSVDSPAAIVYTSGTTGAPKGVTLSHRNLEINTRSILAYLNIGSGDVIVNVLPLHYSFGNSVLHTHLAAGARLVLGRTLAYPHAVLEAMVQESATGFSGVPSSYAVLLERVRLHEYDLRSVRYLTQAGGAMSPALIDRVRSQFAGARFYVMYGQTEATARLSFVPPECLEEKRGSIGIAIPGVELDLRDEQGNSVPQGAVGEIWARGENIMLGYWNEPEATRAVIQRGWLKTGDLAHRDLDGYIFIDGRRNEMIKSGAHRISPLEVEEVIAALPGVAEVACTGIPDHRLGQVVKAVVVRRAGAAVGQSDVQRHCRERLPAYKVPRVVDFADALPRTASGKVQRYRLQ